LTLTSAAALLVGASLFGQVLGFLRTQVINGQFQAVGPGSTDAYFAAFKIPDFFFYTIAAGALGVAFMPFLTDKLEKGDRKSVWEMTSGLLNLLGILMAVVGVIMLVFTEPLARLVMSNNAGPDQIDNAVTIMRLIALNPLLFTISGILTSLQQTFGRFFFFAIAPLIYNGCIIVSAYVFKDSLGIIGLGIGALIGAILQLLVVCFGLYGMRFQYRPTINWHSVDFRRMLKQLPPRSLDQGIDGVNSIVETNRAGSIGQGVISFYENAFILHMAPILLIGTTISTAAFPRLNQRLSQGRPDLYRRDFLRILSVLFWIIMPVAVISYFARGHLARIIYKNNAPEIAVIFGFLVGAVLFRTLYSLISRYFYSHKDTKTPLFVSLFAVALNIYLAFVLSRLYEAPGLALAQSIVAAFEVFVLLLIMMWRDHKLFTVDFWGSVTRTLSVTGFTALTAYTMVKLVPLLDTDRGFITLSTKLLLVAVPAIVVHIVISSIFGMEEVRPVMNKLRKLILKPVRIQ
ncbi:MAG: lipid II flippase MurJ, partial [Candidatus Saccharimonadales bacterium]